MTLWYFETMVIRIIPFCLSLWITACVCVCVCSNRTCLNPILPNGPRPKPHSSLSKSLSTAQTAASISKVKRAIERKAKLSTGGDDLKWSASEPNASKPGIESVRDNIEMKSTLAGRRHGHKRFGTKKFTSTLSSSLKKLKHKADRGLTDDAPWKQQNDPWRKRRSLLASERTSKWSPRRVASSSSLASVSDTDSGKHASSQSRNLLKVVLLYFCYLFIVLLGNVN